MLTRLYIEALLIDEESTDQVWVSWDAGLIPDEVAVWAWWLGSTVDAGMALSPVVHVS